EEIEGEKIPATTRILETRPADDIDNKEIRRQFQESEDALREEASKDDKGQGAAKGKKRKQEDDGAEEQADRGKITKINLPPLPRRTEPFTAEQLKEGLMVICQQGNQRGLAKIVGRESTGEFQAQEYLRHAGGRRYAAVHYDLRAAKSQIGGTIGGNTIPVHYLIHPKDVYLAFGKLDQGTI